jgi:hypothetical protein
VVRTKKNAKYNCFGKDMLVNINHKIMFSISLVPQQLPSKNIIITSATESLLTKTIFKIILGKDQLSPLDNPALANIPNIAKQYKILQLECVSSAQFHRNSVPCNFTMSSFSEPNISRQITYTQGHYCSPGLSSIYRLNYVFQIYHLPKNWVQQFAD